MGAEPEQQVESPNGHHPSTGQRAVTEQAEEPETGTNSDTHSNISADMCT